VLRAPRVAPPCRRDRWPPASPLACLPLTGGVRQLLAQLGSFALQRRPFALGAPARGLRAAAATPLRGRGPPWRCAASRPRTSSLMPGARPELAFARPPNRGRPPRIRRPRPRAPAPPARRAALPGRALPPPSDAAARHCRAAPPPVRGRRSSRPTSSFACETALHFGAGRASAVCRAWTRVSRSRSASAKRPRAAGAPRPASRARTPSAPSARSKSSISRRTSVSATPIALRPSCRSARPGRVAARGSAPASALR